MTCEEIRKYAYVYLDDEFAFEEKVEFEVHLRTCPECRSFVSDELELKRAIKSLEEEMNPHPSLKGRVIKRLEKEKRRRRYFPSFSLSIYAAAASIVAIAIFSVFYFTGGEEDQVDRLVNDHEMSANSEVLGDAAEVEKFVKQHFNSEMDFPLKEGNGIKLLGAKLVSYTGAEGVKYMYLVNGKRVSVLRYPKETKLIGKNRVWVNPKSRYIYLDKARGYSVATFDDGRFNNSIVSDMPDYELVNLVW